MSVTTYIINLYIEPDNGPTEKMQLDMMDIEQEVIKTPVNSNRDQARINEIVARIKSNFPDVQPDENTRTTLKLLIGRLASVVLFSGYILHVPGTINGPAASGLMQGATQKQVDDLTDEIATLKTERQVKSSEIQTQKQEIATLVATLTILQKDKDKISADHKILLNDMVQLRHEKDEAERENSIAVGRAKRAEARIRDIELEKAALQTELDKAKRDSSMVATLRQEEATLRQQVTAAKAVEQHLRKTLTDHQQETEELKRKVREYTNELAKMKMASPDKPDPAKSPYLD